MGVTKCILQLICQDINKYSNTQIHKYTNTQIHKLNECDKMYPPADLPGQLQIRGDQLTEWSTRVA